jgi:hypothetical protein
MERPLIDWVRIGEGMGVDDLMANVRASRIQRYLSSSQNQIVFCCSSILPRFSNQNQDDDDVAAKH